MTEKQYHNAAFTQTSEGLRVVYDTEPCVRPYGPPSPPPITPETAEEEHETQRVNNDARHVDVLEVDEWDNFDEP